jgi:transcriptional regulator with XRE-family HTH domain
MNTNTFANTLNALRKERHLTVRELSKLANVGEPLISGLQQGNRRIGECAARKLGTALKLIGQELDTFIYQAINNCSEKVLNSSKAYPAELLNLVAGELNSLGISPDWIARCVRKPQNADATVFLNDGRSATINLEVAIR